MPAYHISYLQTQHTLVRLLALILMVRRCNFIQELVFIFACPTAGFTRILPLVPMPFVLLPDCSRMMLSPDHKFNLEEKSLVGIRLTVTHAKFLLVIRTNALQQPLFSGVRWFSYKNNLFLDSFYYLKIFFACFLHQILLHGSTPTICG